MDLLHKKKKNTPDSNLAIRNLLSTTEINDRVLGLADVDVSKKAMPSCSWSGNITLGLHYPEDEGNTVCT